MGWKDISCYGSPNVSTPNIDRLAAEGVSFDRAFDVTSTCSSSRATYITGQYPHTNGVLGLTHRNQDFVLPAGYETLPALLQRAGYFTAIEGKWDVAFWAPVVDYGYDELLTPVPTTVVIKNASDHPWAETLLADPSYAWIGEPRIQHELYDLQADPNERTNLADAANHQNMRADLAAHLDGHTEATSDPFLGRSFEQE